MAATRLTHRIVYLDPDESTIIPHIDKGSVFPVGVTFTGGGNKRFIVNVIVLEAVSDEDAAKEAENG